jgi:hypothetical protein
MEFSNRNYLNKGSLGKFIDKNNKQKSNALKWINKFQKKKKEYKEGENWIFKW